MFKNYSSLTVLIIFTVILSVVVGCKGTSEPLGHQGAFDVPTATATVTSTPGPVTISCAVNYPNTSTSGIGWVLLDPNGNTVGASTTNSASLIFNPNFYGTYTMAVTTQGIYGYSTTPVTINGSGSYSGTFTASSFSISTNPTSYSYQSNLAYQTPITVTYNQSGNLSIPVSVYMTSLPSAFSLSNSYFIFNKNGDSASLTITKNSCYTSNTNMQFIANRLDNVRINSTNLLSINRGYSIPVSLIIQSGYVTPATETGTYSAPSSFGFNLELLDGSLGCDSYPVSIFTYPAGNTGSTNYTTSTNAIPQSAFLLTTNTYQNIHFYITTPDGIIHDSGLLQEVTTDTYNSTTLTYTFFVDLGTISNNYSIINQNTVTNDNVLISTSY